MHVKARAVDPDPVILVGSQDRIWTGSNSDPHSNLRSDSDPV